MALTITGIVPIMKRIKLDMNKNYFNTVDYYANFRKGSKIPTIGRKVNSRYDVMEGKEPVDVVIKFNTKEYGTLANGYLIIIKPEKAQEYKLKRTYQGTTDAEFKKDIDTIFFNGEPDEEYEQAYLEMLNMKFDEEISRTYNGDNEITTYFAKKYFDLINENLPQMYGITADEYRKFVKEFLYKENLYEIRTPENQYGLERYLYDKARERYRKQGKTLDYYRPNVDIKIIQKDNKKFAIAYTITNLEKKIIASIEDTSSVAKKVKARLGIE
jgi:hypothetical protein